MSQVLIQVQNLSIDFTTDGRVLPAVKDISFCVGRGEIIAIVGESGSGKSVTSLAMMGLLPKQAAIKGRVLFSPTEKNTTELLTLQQKEMNAIRGRDIAMIFQEPMTSLNPVLTVGFQVAETIQLHQKIAAATSKQQAVMLFEKVKLPDPAAIINKYPHQLSGGQKQRVMIAMAISCNPALLIADEPTTALDVTVQKTILELIKELQLQTGMSVIFISHDLGLVADIANHVLVMYKGEIVEQGNTSTVLNNPAHPYTRALMACRPAMHTRGKRLPVVSDFIPPNPQEQVTKITGNPLNNGHHFVLEGFNSENVLPEEAHSLLGQKPATKNSISEVNKPSKLSTPEIALQVEDLKVYYPGKKTLFGKTSQPFRAVDDVSFTVGKGETVGLVGESGCGKTTLGRAILQLVKPSGGKILLNGTDLTQLSKKDMRPFRKNLQIVFQDPYGSLNPRLTIGEAIREPMTAYGVLENSAARKGKVMDLLEKVNLSPDHFYRYPHQFSGGQRQRICIARALALNPSFLIFDESVSALDVSVQAQVLNLLNSLKQEFGFTSIFISHDLSVVRYISDRIMVMYQGKIIEEGAADEVYFSPKETYTQHLIASIPGKSLISRNPYLN